MEHSENDLSEAMGQLSVTADNSNKTSPSLSDMPIDVVGPIIDKLNYRQQLKLRKVSTSLRALVDKQKPACKKISIFCSWHSVNIKFDDCFVTYTSGDGYGEGVKVIGDDYKTAIVRDDYEKIAFDDLASTLKNTKLQLEKLDISVHVFKKKGLEEYYNEIQSVLESLNHQVSVKKVNLQVLSPSNLLSILPFLKPGVLENIWLDVLGSENEDDWSGDSSGMDQVARLVQWKQAEELELNDCFDLFPMESATHFKRFRISRHDIETDKFIRIKDYISKLRNLEQFILSSRGFDFFFDLDQVLGEPVSSNETEEVFHYSIPDSDCYLEFTKSTETDDIKIVKKKRENI